MQLGFIDLRCLYIERQLNPNRSRTSGNGLVKCAFQLAANGFRITDGHGILGDRPGHRHNVAFLRPDLTNFGIVGDQVGSDLAGKNNEGHRIHPGSDHPGKGVHRSRAGGSHASANPPGHARMALSSHRACLFMIVAVVSYSGIAAQRIEQMHDAASGSQKNVLDPAIHQKLNDVIR